MALFRTNMETPLWGCSRSTRRTKVKFNKIMKKRSLKQNRMTTSTMLCLSNLPLRIWLIFLTSKRRENWLAQTKTQTPNCSQTSTFLQMLLKWFKMSSNFNNNCPLSSKETHTKGQMRTKVLAIESIQTKRVSTMMNWIWINPSSNPTHKSNFNFFNKCSPPM